MIRLAGIANERKSSAYEGLIKRSTKNTTTGSKVRYLTAIKRKRGNTITYATTCLIRGNSKRNNTAPRRVAKVMLTPRERKLKAPANSFSRCTNTLLQKADLRKMVPWCADVITCVLIDKTLYTIYCAFSILRYT
jgi:hypothetical protein